MKERYERKMVEGVIPTGDYGLDFYNRIRSEQFDDSELEFRRDLLQELRLLRGSFSIIVEEETPEPEITGIEPIILMNENYFLETRLSTNNTRKFLLYDNELRIIVKSSDIIEIINLLQLR